MANENEELEDFLAGMLREREPIVLLEAGCGSMSQIHIGNVKRVVGIDLSFDRLKRNSLVQEKIVADLQDYPVAKKAFDLIVCWNVIEHLSNPQAVLESFFRSLRDRGIVVLAFPNLFSLKGLITRFTPYWVHVLFYRFAIGDKRKEDFEQFPTYLRLFIEPRRLKKFAESRGLIVRRFLIYEGPVQEYWRHQSRIVDALFSLLGVFSRLLTFKRLDLNLSDCIVVIENPGESS